MKTTYVAKSFNPLHEQVIALAEAICQEYSRQGYRLTLRQLYYQFIARDLFPESRRNAAGTKNHQQNYKWLGDLCGDARLAGLIDWRHLTDVTRQSSGGDSGWDSPEDAILSVNSWYGVTHWDNQPNYIEVWVEKEALEDVVGQAARRWDVATLACKGYVSLSSMHDAALRLRQQEREGRKPYILYLGDHDPSGIDMSRDIEDRLNTFLARPVVERLALNMDQVDELNPPPSPAKITDSRAKDYIERFGEDSWELDALEPSYLDNLVQDRIRELCDLDLRQVRLDKEERDKRVIRAFSENFDLLLDHLRDEGLVDEDDVDGQ